MATVVLQNSVFMHLAATGGAATTHAFAQRNAVTYDYRYRIAQPIDKGYFYDKKCRLFMQKDDKLQYARIRGPIHSDLTELRKEDHAKPKLAVVRDPVAWYKSYWTLNFRKKWKGHVDNPYLHNGGDKDFKVWINNMLHDCLPDQEGYYTKYAKRFLGEPELTRTHVIRYEYLAYDLHIALELLLENWRAASDMKRNKPQSISAALKLTKKQLGMIDALDSWIYQFYP